MKRTITYAMISLVAMGGLMSYAEEKMECKDGVCSIESSKNAAVAVQEEKKVVPQENVIEITTDSFDNVVKNAAKPVVIDFYATWCQPCTAIKPIFAELAHEEKDWVFGAIDIDKNPTIMQNCGVQAVPTFIVFKNGIQWGMIKGGLPKEQLMQELKKIAAMEKPAERSQSQQERMFELLTAINQRNSDAVKKCIAGGVDVNGLFESPQGSFCPLTIAIMSGTEEMIDILISSGARMDAAVQEASKKQIDASLSMTEALQKNFDYINKRIAALPLPIKQAVKISGPELGRQFMMAVSNGVELKKLIDQGADVNTILTLGKNQITPICLAMILDNKDAIDMLIDAGALLSLEVINEFGSKESLENGIKRDIENYRQGIIKSRERLAYALSKTK